LDSTNDFDYPDSKGLGLYLVKSQIEAMGGNISIQSEVNITTFTLTFKTNNMLDQILCIDDDPITLMLCKKVVAKTNF
jgi:K+-sensing histidine kinase KdpD